MVFGCCFLCFFFSTLFSSFEFNFGLCDFMHTSSSYHYFILSLITYLLWQFLELPLLETVLC
ncbi:hypothetical protein DFH27DRAFT_328499 [Peziza echinospora]|nr:hypothetical protein DFH27DRAFT_328499 [Peziza echinospora]